MKLRCLMRPPSAVNRHNFRPAFVTDAVHGRPLLARVSWNFTANCSRWSRRFGWPQLYRGCAINAVSARLFSAHPKFSTLSLIISRSAAVNGMEFDAKVALVTVIHRALQSADLNVAFAKPRRSNFIGTVFWTQYLYICTYIHTNVYVCMYVCTHVIWLRPILPDNGCDTRLRVLLMYW